ncbi:CLUMA_CG001663, isoform A [Clunio marinus]|uniref:CLUMA_CG001663, isoform A n=1 Tax=Clunio marinus TaxID=568069 RepID=A0A1J1HKD8_9DIPT|nr:CLUMA_CG001663, isoform A [Clunio marinus]
MRKNDNQRILEELLAISFYDVKLPDEILFDQTTYLSFMHLNELRNLKIKPLSSCRIKFLLCSLQHTIYWVLTEIMHSQEYVHKKCECKWNVPDLNI